MYCGCNNCVYLAHWTNFFRFIIIKSTGYVSFFRITRWIVKMSWKIGSFPKHTIIMCLWFVQVCIITWNLFNIICRCCWWKTCCSWNWKIWRPWMRVISASSFESSYSSHNKLLIMLLILTWGLIVHSTTFFNKNIYNSRSCCAMSWLETVLLQAHLITKRRALGAFSL